MEATRETVRAGVRTVKKRSKCTVEANTIVPDKNPDILKILQVDAVCKIDEKRIRDGRISVEGKIYADVIYLPDGETGIRVLPTEFEYNDVIECEDFSEDIKATVTADVSDVSINLVNSRKITVQASVVTDVEAVLEREIEFISNVDGDDIAYKTDNASLYSVVAHNFNEFTLKEEVEIPAERRGVERVLKIDATVADKEVNASCNKVIVKGAIVANTLYYTADGTFDCLETSFPFTEVFETCDLTGDEYIDVRATIKEQHCRKSDNLGEECRTLSYEFPIELELSITKEEEISFVSDCFFFNAETNLEIKNIEAEELHHHSSGIKTAHEAVRINSGMPSVLSVYNIITHPVVRSTEIIGDGVEVNGRIEVSILYLSDRDDAPICCQKSEIPISHRFDCKTCGRLTAYAKCEHITYALTSTGEVDIRAAYEIKLEEREAKTLSIISDVNKGEEDLDVEMIIFFANRDEEVWNIAKKYKLSPKYLAQLNDLDEYGVVEKGRKIIIP